jgi:hypothetical protein
MAKMVYGKFPGLEGGMLPWIKDIALRQFKRDGDDWPSLFSSHGRCPLKNRIERLTWRQTADWLRTTDGRDWATEEEAYDRDGDVVDATNRRAVKWCAFGMAKRLFSLSRSNSYLEHVPERIVAVNDTACHRHDIADFIDHLVDDGKEHDV